MAINIDEFLTVPEHAAIDHTGLPGITGNLPVGGCIPWMSSVAAAGNAQTAPTGYEFADGTNVVTVGSPLLGFPKPDLRGSGKFVRALTNPATVVGGATAHPTAVDATHTHGPGSFAATHTHPIVADLVAGHTHTISTDGDHRHDLGAAGGALQPLGGGNFTDFQGDHDHTGVSGSTSLSHTHGGATSSTAAAVAGLSDATQAPAPAHVQMLWIIRVI